MRALVLSCTLKPSPAVSNTEALARVVTDAREAEGVATETLRVGADRGPRRRGAIPSNRSLTPVYGA